MDYIRCPHCGSDTPAVLSRCRNCHERLSANKNSDIIDAEPINNYITVSSKKSKGFTKFIILGTMSVILIIAAIKNPSVTESKQLIKDAAIEKINGKLSSNVLSGTQQFASMLGMFLAPTLLDKFVTIDVNDYVVFSTFKATIVVIEEHKNLASGIIVFGNVVPLSSDIEVANRQEDTTSETRHVF